MSAKATGIGRIALLLIAAGAMAQLAHAQSTASHRVALKVTEASAVAFDESALVLAITSPSFAEGFRTLRYTTINSPDTTRDILVQWGDRRSAPPGTSLRISATNVPHDCGVAAPELTVDDIPQSLITRIPTCTTSMAAGAAVLRYRLIMENTPWSLSDRKTEVSVLFTVSDK